MARFTKGAIFAGLVATFLVDQSSPQQAIITNQRQISDDEIELTIQLPSLNQDDTQISKLNTLYIAGDTGGDENPISDQDTFDAAAIKKVIPLNLDPASPDFPTEYKVVVKLDNPQYEMNYFFATQVD